ncbi:hypothetical protein [Mycobacterium xenopi]|nr:hypothetical protein [Mycobacterium xenopi]
MSEPAMGQGSFDDASVIGGATSQTCCQPILSRPNWRKLFGGLNTADARVHLIRAALRLPAAGEPGH